MTYRLFYKNYDLKNLVTLKFDHMSLFSFVTNMTHVCISAGLLLVERASHTFIAFVSYFDVISLLRPSSNAQNGAKTHTWHICGKMTEQWAFNKI